MTSPISDSLRATERQLDFGTWGAFFVWIGIALLATLPWGMWLLGVGVIVLGAQVVRRFLGLPAEIFWIVVGGLFVLGGISEVAQLELDIAIIPIVCIAAGAVLIANALRGQRHEAHQL